MKPSTIFGREPAVVLGFVQVVIALAVGFGLDLSTSQQALIFAAAAALIALIVRSQVTPVASIAEKSETR
jgi:hypothetical protein